MTVSHILDGRQLLRTLVSSSDFIYILYIDMFTSSTRLIEQVYQFKDRLFVVWYPITLTFTKHIPKAVELLVSQL
jgi:hypothetical protein